MLSISECRKILGKKYENCTDQQIKQIREWLYTIAKLQLEGLTNNQKIEFNEGTQYEFKNAS